jgi:di/tripeptidase
MDSETTAMMAKEDRKLNDWNRIVDARKADVASWSRERSKIEAAKFLSDYQHETVFVGHNGFYARVDMLRDVEANSLYMEAVKVAAPKIFNQAMTEMTQRLQNKAENLRRHSTLSNTASTPYQDGKVKANLSHAKDLKPQEPRSIKR